MATVGDPFDGFHLWGGEGSPMKAATRWRDWTNVGTGTWLAASPWVLGTAADGASTQNALWVGLLVLAASLWAVARPASRGAQWTNLALGQRHRIHSGAQTIRITVPREPARAGIDPWRRLLDREGEDDVVAVATAVADPVGTGR
jgi:hypothetical protein